MLEGRKGDKRGLCYQELVVSPAPLCRPEVGRGAEETEK